MSKKIALIDGYGFVFRAYHSLPPLTRNDGTPVGAVFGFTNMLIKLLASLDVTHIAVVFDAGSKTFRNDIYPAYKANRPPCPEDLIPQFPIVRQAAESLNLTILEKAGFEADDIIATIAKKYSNNEDSVIIVSSDKDLMQLVNDNISMYDAMKNKLITPQEVKEKFNVLPEKVLDMLALMGDSSDNIPGVKGIGPKTAAELLDNFGDLDGIFANLDQIKQAKRKQCLEEGQDNARLSKILAALKEDVELGIELHDLALKNIEPQKLVDFLNEQGFRSLMMRVQKEFGINSDKAQSKSPNTTTATNDTGFSKSKKTKITSSNDIDRLHKIAQKNGQITIDYQKNYDTNSLDLITLSSCKLHETPQEIFYFNVGNSSFNQQEQTQTQDLFSFSSNDEKPASDSLNCNVIQPILQDDSIKKIFFNSKEFFKTIDHQSQDIVYEDVLLINHLVNSSLKNSFFEITEVTIDENLEELGFANIFSELEKARQGKKYDSDILANDEKRTSFFAFRNFALSQIYRFLSPKIFDLKLNFAYRCFELPLLDVIAKMENNGVKVDVQKLKNLSDEFAQNIGELTQKIYAAAGQEFNIASTQQLSKILFETLNLTPGNKSKKTGALSTKSSILEELAAQGHDIAQYVLDFRKFSKLKNTYSDALPKEINQKTGRIHSHFSTTSTITGRFSSSNPNLQNIPIRSVEGQKIRQSFIAQKDHYLIAADYSQIELRVIAHVAKIDNLIKAFKDDKDIHQITASQVMGIAEEEVTKEMRSQAKAINFGIIYGISAFGLAKQLNISKQAAQEYIDSYLETYPGIDSFMQETIAFAQSNGYVKTLSGRKCFIHDINNKNFMVKSEAQRLAINAPIQGSAADIIKKAMIRLDQKFNQQQLKSKLVLQVHDELVIEAPQDEVEIAQKILKTEMENAMHLDLPLKVDLTVSKNWH